MTSAPHRSADAPRVAIVHYWLVDRRGGERVVEALAEMYPQADIFTNVYDPAVFAETLQGHRVFTSFVNRLPWSKKLLGPYMLLMPLALEQLDLRGYDLVISSESGPAKGVVVGPDAIHVCYCHSPMRYAWDLYHHYLERASSWKRFAMRPLLHYLRMWDQITAQRPDFIIANSRHTRGRIKKYWRRDAVVIPPPVDVEPFAAAGAVTEPGDYYLCAGQLESYKRIDLAVETFNRLRLPLVVAGVGPELDNVKRIAGPTIRFLGWKPDEELTQIVAGCRALIFPGEEDFGIVPVEAMAAGRPVIAFRHGGALDSVVENETGMFFDEQTCESLADAVQRFEARRDRFDSARITNHARGFARRRFQQRVASAVARLRPDF